MWDFGFHLFGGEMDVRVRVGDGDLESWRSHLEHEQVWSLEVFVRMGFERICQNFICISHQGSFLYLCSYQFSLYA